MQTKNAIGNLINRYRAVLKKCNILNTFGTLAMAGMLIVGSTGIASVANAASLTITTTGNITIDQATIDANGVNSGELLTYWGRYGVQNISVNGDTNIDSNFRILGRNGKSTLTVDAEHLTVDGTTTIQGYNNSNRAGILSIKDTGEFTSTGQVLMNNWSQLYIKNTMNANQGTLVNGNGQIWLQGNHNGDLRLNNYSARVYSGVNNTSGGTINGNVTLTKGWIMVNKGTNLDINGNVNIRQAGIYAYEGTSETDRTSINVTGNVTAISSSGSQWLVQNDHVDTKIGGNLEIHRNISPDEFGEGSTLTVGSLSGTGDISVGNTLNETNTVNVKNTAGVWGSINITHETTAIANANKAQEIILGEEGIVKAGAVTIVNNELKLGTLTANTVTTKSGDLIIGTIDVAGVTTANLTLRAANSGNTLGVNTITVNTDSNLTLGGKGETGIVSTNAEITLVGKLDGSNEIADEMLHLNSGTFTIDKLTTSNVIIESKSGVSGVLNVNEFTVEKSTNILGGVIHADTITLVGDGTLTPTAGAGSKLFIDGGNVTANTLIGDVSTTLELDHVVFNLKNVDDLSKFKSAIEIDAHGIFIVGDYKMSNQTGVESHLDLTIKSGGIFQAQSLTLDWNSEFNFVGDGTDGIAAGGVVGTNTIVMKDGTTDNSFKITTGTLAVNGTGEGEVAITASGITLDADTGSFADAVLTLGSKGGTTGNLAGDTETTITATKGTLNVNGNWNTGDITLGATSVLNIDDGSLDLTGNTFTVTDGAKITATTGSTLTVDSLKLAATSTLTVDHSDIVINSTAAGDFESTADKIILSDVSTLTIHENLLLDVAGTALATGVGTILSADGTSTVNVTGDTLADGGKTYTLTEIKNLKDVIFGANPASTGFVSVTNITIDPANLVGGRVESVLIDGSSANITNQTAFGGLAAEVDVASDKIADSLHSFASKNIYVHADATDDASSEITFGHDSNTSVVKIVGNDIITYAADTNGGSDIRGVGKINIDATDKNSTVALDGATNGSLDTVTLTGGNADVTKEAKLVINGIYTINNIIGAGITAQSTVNVVSGTLNVNEFKLADLNAKAGSIINIGNVNQGNLTIGTDHSALGTILFSADEIVNVTIKTIGNLQDADTESTITITDGGIVAIGAEDGGLGVNATPEWLATSMTKAGLLFGMGERNNMVSSVFGVSSVLDLHEAYEGLDGKGEVKNFTHEHILNVGTTGATAGGAKFGAESLFVVDSTGIGLVDAEGNGDFALTGTTIEAAAGAKLLISDVVLTSGEATLNIAKGTTLLTLGDGAWGYDSTTTDSQDFDSLLFEHAFLTGTTVYDASNKEFVVEIEQISAQDALDNDLHAGLADLIDQAVANGKATQFIKTASLTGKSSVMEGGAKLTTVAGVKPTLHAVSNSGINNLKARTSIAGFSSVAALNYEGDTTKLVAAADGSNMQNGFGVWAMPMYQMTSTDDLESGAFNYGHDTSLYGVSVGVDYTYHVENDLNNKSNLRLGALFNVGSGTTDSTGHFEDTTNEFDYYGVGIYGTYHWNRVGLTADVGYTLSTNDISQDHSGTNLTTTPDANLISVGLRGEYLIPTKGINLIPYAGVRWNLSIVDEHHSIFQNSTAFINDEQTTSIFEVPIGISLRKEIETAGGMSIIPRLDIGVRFAAGDLESEHGVRIPDVSGSANMNSEAVDPMTFQSALGIAFDINDFSLDLDYKFDLSANMNNHGIFGTFRYNF